MQNDEAVEAARTARNQPPDLDGMAAHRAAHRTEQREAARARTRAAAPLIQAHRQQFTAQRTPGAVVPPLPPVDGDDAA